MAASLAKLCGYRTTEIDSDKIPGNFYVSRETMMPNKGGIIPGATPPASQKVTSFETDDILISNIRPYFKKIWQADCSGGCSNDVLVFQATTCEPSFLYYVLSSDQFFDYSTRASKDTKMPRGDKDSIMKFEVPSFERPQQIAISTCLGALDDKIRLNNRINDIWKSLNNILSPDEADKLLDGSLFAYECPECGGIIEFCHACLYHDMQYHAMVQCVPSEDQVEKARENLDCTLDGNLPLQALGESSYRYRIALDHNALREKAFIFRDGLDDCAIELLKLIVEMSAKENVGTGECDTDVHYLCIGDDGSLEFEVQSEDVGIAFIPREAYERFLLNLGEEVSREYFVDRAWAIEHFGMLSRG